MTIRNSHDMAAFEQAFSARLLALADSDEAGRLFQGEAGHLFRFHSGQCSDLKPDTLLV
jgi:hypothetical protein